jgi:MFS family permease
MTERPTPSKIFFGWWTVLTSGIIAFWGVGFVSYGFSVLFKPIASDLMLSRAVTSTATSVQSLGYGVVGPIGGWASDKYSPKWVILFGICCLTLGCISMYFVSSLWSLLVVWGLVIGVGYSLGFTVITDKAIVNWFVKKSGLALNIKFAIQSLSGLLLLPFIAWLNTNQGWRLTSVIMGLLILFISFPLVWFLVKPYRPEHYGLLPDGASVNEIVPNNERLNSSEDKNAANLEGMQFTLRQTMKTSSYWLMIALWLISNLAAPIMSVHCVPFLTDMGIDPVKAASMMSIWVTCTIPARIAAGYVVDRMKTRNLRFIMVGGFFLQAIGVTSFLFTRNISMIYVWFVLYGIGSGASSGPFIPMLASYFGRKAFGSIIGTLLLFIMPVTLVAPIYVGWIYDTTGSYSNVFGLFAILLAVSGIVAGLVLPPKQPKAALQIVGA